MAALASSGCGTTEITREESRQAEVEETRDIDREIRTAERITADIPLSILLQTLDLPSPRPGQDPERHDPAQDHRADRGEETRTDPPALDPDSLVRITIDRQTETVERERTERTERSEEQIEETEITERTWPFSGFRTGFIVALVLVIAGYLAFRFGLPRVFTR